MNSQLSEFQRHFSAIAFWTGLAIAGLAFLVGNWLDLSRDQSITLALTLACATWWCTEAIPIPVTSLVPFVVFPLASILDHHDLAAAYGNKFILLFMAGFMLSKGAERTKTHLRISHAIMDWIGTGSHRRLVIGFMLSAAFCSMWISNTATALILLPVALAVLEDQREPRLQLPLLLAVAYGCSIGGIATIIGTPPNGVFASVYQQQTGMEVDFLSWVKMALPVSILMLMATGIVLTFRLNSGQEHDLEDLGPWRPAQKRVVMILSMTALLWMTRNAPWGGWSEWFNLPNAEDATIGLLGVLLMFLIPAGTYNEQGMPEKLLNWQSARDIPWGVLILFAGGLAIAKGFEKSGLSEEVGGLLASLSGMPVFLLILMICLTVTFLTEMTSNTATTSLLMPILASAAAGLNLEPIVLMVPATMSASCAFMLPVATPPNAIVFGSEKITIAQMARTGLTLNLIGALIISSCCLILVH